MNYYYEGKTWRIEYRVIDLREHLYDIHLECGEDELSLDSMPPRMQRIIEVAVDEDAWASRADDVYDQWVDA